MDNGFAVLARRRRGVGSMYLLRDTFTDANGTALASHTMDVGPGWTVHSGTWTIQSNALVKGGSGQHVASADAGTANHSVSLTLDSTSGLARGGPVARCVDGSNYWLAYVDSGTPAFILYDVTAGGFTARASYTISIPAGVHTAVLTCSGTAITASLDGVPRLSHTSATRQSATRCGIEIYDFPRPLDDFTVVAP